MAWEIEEEQFGDAILSRFPMQLIKAGKLPNPSGSRSETRGALWVEVDVKGSRIQLLNTHLAVDSRTRRCQLTGLLGEEWLGAALGLGPVVLCGDFNCGPLSREYPRL